MNIRSQNKNNIDGVKYWLQNLMRVSNIRVTKFNPSAEGTLDPRLAKLYKKKLHPNKIGLQKKLFRASPKHNKNELVTIAFGKFMAPTIFPTLKALKGTTKY